MTAIYIFLSLIILVALIFAKKVANMITGEINCKRIGVMVCGLEVPHTHVHLVPINEISDLNFANAQPASNEDLAEIAERIRKNTD